MTYQSYKRSQNKVLKYLIFFILLALLLGAAGVDQNPVMAFGEDGLAPLITDVEDAITDHYVVVYKDTLPGEVADAADVDTSAIEAAGGEVTFVYDTALQGFAAYLPPAALEIVRQNPRVDYVILDGRVHLNDDETATGDDGASIETVQDSPVWGLDRIDQRALPLDNRYIYATDASVVHVYILDSGIRSTHFEFGMRATKDYDAIGDGQNGNDCNGHGTHVAGTIGGTHYGVAKGVSLHAVRVLDCDGNGTWSQIIAGINWVANNAKKPAVANMSLWNYYYAPVNTAVTNAINKRITFVIAAGNSDDDACFYSPASTPNAITVGATDCNTDIRIFSNWGSCVDLFAPGIHIWSSSIEYDTAADFMYGTDPAAAHVAGVAALYLSQNPTASPSRVASVLLSMATPGVVLDPMGSPNLLLYSRVAGLTVPVLQAPSGILTDRTPSYEWAEVPTATQYRLQLRIGTSVVYNKLLGTEVCSSGICSDTPLDVLDFNKYNWRVQALVNGVWRSWSTLSGFTLVNAPTPLSPNAPTMDTTPTFTWAKITGATQYRIQLLRGGTTVYLKAAACTTTTCSLTPPNLLVYDDYKWRVQANLNGLWGDWSYYQDFDVVRPGFISDFNGDKAGWKNIVGNWPIYQDQYLISTGAAGLFNSVQYNAPYPTFSYEAVMKRVGDSLSATALFVRGTPDPLREDGGWYSGYYFAYTNSGHFSVWRFLDIREEPMQDWTYSPSIIPDSFNTLKVVGDGPNFKFYINGTLVWSGMQDSFATGYPGITFYSPYAPGNRLLVNWARISTVNLTAQELDPNEQVESGQIVVGGDNPFVAPAFDPANIQ